MICLSYSIWSKRNDTSTPLPSALLFTETTVPCTPEFNRIFPWFGNGTSCAIYASTFCPVAASSAESPLCSFTGRIVPAGIGLAATGPTLAPALEFAVKEFLAGNTNAKASAATNSRTPAAGTCGFWLLVGAALRGHLGFLIPPGAPCFLLTWVLVPLLCRVPHSPLSRVGLGSLFSANSAAPLFPLR